MSYYLIDGYGGGILLVPQINFEISFTIDGEDCYTHLYDNDDWYDIVGLWMVGHRQFGVQYGKQQLEIVGVYNWVTPPTVNWNSFTRPVQSKQKD